MIGSTIGSYRITKLLGEGGMGAVYQATDNIEREVAIKVLRPQLTHDATRLARFRSEALALGQLHHPNITSLFHWLEEDGACYLVMEFVAGQTLEEMLCQQGALAPQRALAVLLDSLPGFEHAHARGVIHRDIKASNLMVSVEGTTKITDFGIARRDGAARLTQKGQPLGTLEYMSPEQVRGLEGDVRSDIYSLGILLFELLTGRVPFADANPFELMRAHLEKAPPPPRFLVPTLPPELDRIAAKALAKDPQSRFQSVAELRAALETVAARWPADAGASTPASASIARTATPPTQPIHQPPASGRPATLPSGEERYGTRLQGTPLPFIAAIPAPPPVAPAIPAPMAPASSPAASKAATRSRFPALVAGAVALLLVGALGAALLRPAFQKQGAFSRGASHRVPGASLARSHAAPRENAPQSALHSPQAGALERPPLSAAPRFRRLRSRPSKLPRRRSGRDAVSRRFSAHRPARTSAKISRTVGPRLIAPGHRGGGEGSVLRALIKGH